MPIPLPIIAAGASIIGQGLNAASQGSMNRKSRQWNEAMYARQRSDALADRDYQNWYDSPSEQMRRLKEGGINPRLAYTTGIQNSGSVTRATNTDAWNPTAPTFDARSAMAAFYDTELRQAQIDNVRAKTETEKWEPILKALQSEGMQFDTGLKNNLQETTMEMAKEQLRKVKTETNISLDRNEREALTNSQSLKESVERILTLRQGRQLSESQKKSIDSDTQLKQLDIQLRKQYNLSPSDPLYVRLLALMLQKFGVNLNP